MPVGGGVVGASLQALFDNLNSPELVNFACQYGVEADLIQGMEEKVSKILPVLNDVGKWLEELKDAVYDAKDVFNLIQTESLRFKLKQSDYPSHTDCAPPLQVLDPSTSSKKRKKKRKKRKRRRTEHCLPLNDKIKEINKRLEGIAQRKEGLELKKGTPGTSAGEDSIVIMKQKLPTSSLEDEPSLYGRDTDVVQLIELLRSVEHCNANVGVIPIVGQGGIGKTAFAQRLYNCMSVKMHFQVRAWVYVSGVFDVIRVTKGIIESASGRCCDLTQLPAIHEALNKILLGKIFFIVLDDVWIEKYEDWNALSTPFRAGAKGSKVIITTRSEKVCSITGTFHSHHLTLLSEEDCFKLLKRHAFSIQNSDAQPALERIGKEIARKCKGLPLAAKALGGVLRSKREKFEWEEILYDKTWDLETALGPALWLFFSGERKMY